MRPIPSLAEVEAYLHQHIPLSAGMGISVVACDVSGVTLRAPLAPNINHHSSVFGGSTSAVGILSAWTWLHFALLTAGYTSRLVIQRNSVEYLAPIRQDFEARCPGMPAGQFDEFVRTLERYGRARASLAAELTSEGKKVAIFAGDYVAAR
jgi:thioesterase domain-containing protein